MASIATSQEIGPKLIDALGLPKHCIWFELRCAYDEPVTVRCEYYPETQEGMLLETILAEYKVVERTVAQEPAPFDFDAWLNMRKAVAHAAMIERHKALSRMDERLFCKR